MPADNLQDSAKSGEAKAAAQREGFVRDVVSFLAYHTYMALPDSIAFRCNWMLPSVGDWAYREDRRAALSRAGSAQ